MSGMFLFPVQLTTKCAESLVGKIKNNMKILSKKSTFQTVTLVEINGINYSVLTKGTLCPNTGKKSKAITFDFQREDGNRLTNAEHSIGDKIFDEIIKD